MSFASSKEAWDFIASRIAGEATRQGVALSELEKKILCLSESDPTQTDMAGMSESVDDECDDVQCAKRIRALSRKAFRQDQKDSPGNVQLWREAIKVIRNKEDYLLALLDVPRPASDIVKLVVAALAVTAAGVGAIFAYHWAGENIHFRVPDYIGYAVVFLGFVLAYWLAFSDKAKKLGDWFEKLMDRVARWF